MRPEISVVIPALNEAMFLGDTLDAVRRLHAPIEIIVVDGGSKDNTIEIARRSGATVLSTARGRGLQMAAGAQAAQGRCFWFLHADTHPPPDAAGQICEALRDSTVIGGHFRIHFRGKNYSSRVLTWIYPRLRLLGLTYGDSALFVRREAYQQVGGFEPFPIFEDLDLIRRLRRRGRFVCVAAAVATSSRRFEGRSFVLTFARWTTMQILYWMGVHPQVLARFYAPIR